MSEAYLPKLNKFNLKTINDPHMMTETKLFAHRGANTGMITPDRRSGHNYSVNLASHHKLDSSLQSEQKSSTMMQQAAFPSPKLMLGGDKLSQTASRRNIHSMQLLQKNINEQSNAIAAPNNKDLKHLNVI